LLRECRPFNVTATARQSGKRRKRAAAEPSAGAGRLPPRPSRAMMPCRASACVIAFCRQQRRAMMPRFVFSAPPPERSFASALQRRRLKQKRYGFHYICSPLVFSFAPPSPCPLPQTFACIFSRFVLLNSACQFYEPKADMAGGREQRDALRSRCAACSAAEQQQRYGVHRAFFCPIPSCFSTACMRRPAPRASRCCEEARSAVLRAVHDEARPPPSLGYHEPAAQQTRRFAPQSSPAKFSRQRHRRAFSRRRQPRQPREFERVVLHIVHSALLPSRHRLARTPCCSRRHCLPTARPFTSRHVKMRQPRCSPPRPETLFVQNEVHVSAEEDRRKSGGAEH